MSTTKARFWREVVPWLLLASVALLAVGAAVVGASGPRQSPVSGKSSPPPDYYPPTGFGGYRWHGNVNEIEAVWRVPSIGNTHQPGAESTWIGVQGPGADEPFIQLGTAGTVTGSPFAPGGGAAAESSSPPPLMRTDYEVFWSDTSRRFLPVPIVGLRHPGDLILFKITRNANGWLLSVKNLTYGWRRSVTVDYGQQDSFTQGEWTQEDPGGYVPGTDFPYADTSPVSFQRVLVNGKIPKFHYADEGALSTQNGVYLVPTPMLNDGFSMVAPSGPALQYLSDAERVDASLTRIGAEIALTEHDHATADSRQVRRFEQMANLYLASANRLEAQPWPRSAAAAVHRLVTTQEALARRLSAWVESKQHSLRRVDVIFADSTGRMAVSNIRRTLGLPPI